MHPDAGADGLEVPEAPAGAAQVCGSRHGQVRDLPRDVMRTPHGPVVEHDSCTDTGADRDDERTRRPGRGTVSMLSCRVRVDVVLHGDGSVGEQMRAESRAHECGQRCTRPVRERIRGGNDRPGSGIHDPGRADADARKAQPAAGEETSGERDDGGDDRHRPLGRRRRGHLGPQQCIVAVGEGRGRLGAADVDGEDDLAHQPTATGSRCSSSRMSRMRATASTSSACTVFAIVA